MAVSLFELVISKLHYILAAVTLEQESYLQRFYFIFKNFKGILHFVLEIGSFYHSTRVKQLSFTVFECI